MPHKDPEKRREYKKRYYEQNKEKYAEHNKRWHAENPEKVAERKKRYREQNPEKIAEKNKRYRAGPAYKQYREQNRERDAERDKQRYQQKKQQGTAGLYAIENKKTGQVYIGQSVYIESRWKEHKNSLKRGDHPNHCLLKDYNEYGAEAFKYSVIKELNKQDFQSEEELTEHLVSEETKMILEKTQSGSKLYNLSLKPTDVANIIQELGQK